MALFEESNPYAPPVRYSPPPQTEFITTQSTAITYREYWHLANNIVEYVFGIIFKTLRLKLPVNYAFGRELIVVDPGAIPETARISFSKWAGQALECGLSHELCYTIASLGPMEGYAAIFSDASRTMFMSVIYAHTWEPATVEMTRVSFGTLMNDQSFLVTSRDKPQLNNPPNIIVQRRINADLPELLSIHQQRLATYPSKPVRFNTTDELERFLREHERKSNDFQLERGVYQLAPTQLVESLRAKYPAT